MNNSKTKTTTNQPNKYHLKNLKENELGLQIQSNIIEEKCTNSMVIKAGMANINNQLESISNNT